MSQAPVPLLLAGLFATTVLAVGSDWAHGPGLIARLQAEADVALAATGARGVRSEFRTGNGWLTRHPRLLGGEGLDPALRAAAARAVAAVPGVSGVQWASTPAASASPRGEGDCAQHVAAILKTRSIRFAEGQAAIDADSAELLDEVAAALRPCSGGIVAVIGHTDAQGDEAANAALSLERARAVREALVLRGIARTDLRARGLGSAQPLSGLDASDPANRRIEFSLVSPAPQPATPVDLPDGG